MAAIQTGSTIAECSLAPVQKPYYFNAMGQLRDAKFKIGAVVKHRLFPFRGVVFDIDPVFANTEEWYQAIPAEVLTAQGPALLSPVRRKRRDRVCRLCLGTEPPAG